MQQLIIELINKFGYFGVTFLIAIENIFPPIPSEIILTFSGFATTKTSLTVPGIILASTIGSVLGAIILYFIGKFLNYELLHAIVQSKLGKILCLRKSDIEKADHWFYNKGSYAVFFGRFIPIVRSLISVPAGMSGMSLKRFVILTTIGTAIWNTVLVLLGYFAGESWHEIVAFVDKYSKLVLVLLIFIGLGLIYWYFKIYVKNRDKDLNSTTKS